MIDFPAHRIFTSLNRLQKNNSSGSERLGLPVPIIESDREEDYERERTTSMCMLHESAWQATSIS